MTGLAAIALTAVTALGADFDPASEAWNGLSELRALAEEAGVTLVADTGADAPLLWIHPVDGVDPDALPARVRAGGRAVLADDFGGGAAALERMGLRRAAVDPKGAELLGGNPALPIARPMGLSPLFGGVERVVANHPTGLEGRSDGPTLTFRGARQDLAAVRRIGEGEVLVLGDPSVLINNMLELRGNRRFARNLLLWLCAGEPCEVALRVGSAMPGAVVEGASGGVDAWDVSSLRDDLPWLALVAFGAAMLLLTFLVPSGGETAWEGRAPPAPQPRPSRFALRAAALAALSDRSDGRLLASLAAARAREDLRAKGLGLRDAYERLAPVAEGGGASALGGLAGLAALLQEIEEAPPASDPYAPGCREWTVGEALALDERAQDRLKALLREEGGGQRAA